ncbi:MAG TPA: hypothetical protein VFT48_04200 [Pyrinomonadaceae bacterium]|nr:hypothetical protein [Pyrinomonadaceae bacterium]
MLKIRANLWLLFLLVSTAFSQTPNCGCEQKPQLTVLAVINGVKIRLQDLNIDTRTQVSIAQETVITARAQELNRQINQMLLDAEAKRRGLTNSVLLVLEVKARVPEPTEAEARAFYEQNKSRIRGSFNSVKKDIIAQLYSERMNVRATQYANALRAGAQITMSNLQVTPPENEADLSRVFATVNGVNITSQDIEKSLLPLIFMVQEQVYRLRKRDLDIRINDLLLEQEAKRLGTTPKALIDLNVRTKVPIVSEEQARTYYKEQKALFSGKFSEHKLQIMQFLQEQGAQKWFVAYAEELRKGAAVQIYLTAPTQPDLRQLCCNPVD